MKDLSTGSIPGHIATMSIQMAIGILVQTLYFFTDLYFVSKLGDAAIALTRVPAAGWRKVDQGKHHAGWNWWQTYEARNDAAGRVLFTVLGTGPRGSYILFIGTTQADFRKNRALYDQWYRSLTLY